MTSEARLKWSRFYDKFGRIIAGPLDIQCFNNEELSNVLKSSIAEKELQETNLRNKATKTVLFVAVNSFNDEDEGFPANHKQITSGNTENESSHTDYIIPKPIFDPSITPFPDESSTNSYFVSQKNSGFFNLGEYPCVKLSWYHNLPKCRKDLTDKSTIVNTKAVSEELKHFLKQHLIPLKMFATHILSRTQGTLSDLLNNPKQWLDLQDKGKKEYIKMMQFLSASNLYDIVAKMKSFSNKAKASTIRLHSLPFSLLSMLQMGNMPSEDELNEIAEQLNLKVPILRQHCFQQVKLVNIEISDVSTNIEQCNVDESQRITDENSESIALICPHFNCGVILHEKNSVKVHLQMHKEQQKHKCYVCKQTFDSAMSLSQHYKLKHESNSRTKPNSKILNYENANKYRFICGICQIGFTSRQRMEQHVLEIHDAELEDHLTCHNCLKIFPRANLLKTHMRIHSNTRPFVCKECNKSFHTKANLQRHLTSHSNLKPFSCSVCNARFTEAKSVKIHMRTHTGEKPYQCSECQKCFTQRGSLQSHMHIHEDKMPHLCELCGQRFRQKSNLKMHVLTHRGIRKYQCSQCDQAFAKKYSLKRHQLTHSGARPYKCNLCMQGFTRLNYLKKHVSKMHPRDIYHCDICNKPYDDLDVFQEHLKIHGINRIAITDQSSSNEQRYESNQNELLCMNEVTLPVVEAANENAILMSTDDMFASQKQFIITTGETCDLKKEIVTINNYTGITSHSQGSMILAATNDTTEVDPSDNTHSVILHTVDMNDSPLTADSAQALLFTEVNNEDSIVGMPIDNDEVQHRDSMVEYSDPNMQSVIVESTEDMMMTHSDIMDHSTSKHGNVTLRSNSGHGQIVLTMTTQDENDNLLIEQSQTQI